MRGDYTPATERSYLLVRAQSEDWLNSRFDVLVVQGDEGNSASGSNYGASNIPLFGECYQQVYYEKDQTCGFTPDGYIDYSICIGTRISSIDFHDVNERRNLIIKRIDIGGVV